MNRFGIVLAGGRVQAPEVRAAILREARAAGWSLQPSPEKDEGLIWFALAS